MRAYSWNQLREMEFDTTEYNLPDHEGECRALLVMKHWGKIANITGYFVTETGEKIKTNSWRDQSYLGLDEIDLDTKLNLVFRKNTKGNIVLDNLRVVQE